MAEDKRSIYNRSGLGHRIGYGKRPALLVVDMQIGFTAPERSPLAGNLDAQVAAISKLMQSPAKTACRSFSRSSATTPTSRRRRAVAREGAHLARAQARLGPGRARSAHPRKPEDLLLVKKYASAFLGTPLSATLVTRGVDTLIVTGCTTSGCVRASVVDALSHGFRPIIPHEAVGDRAQEPHEANLFDMDSKYGDVVSLSDAIAYLEESKS